MLTEEELVRFNSGYNQLEMDLEANDVTSYLVSKLALTHDDVEEIQKEGTRRARMKVLLPILRRKLQSLDHLIEAVQLQRYHGLVRILQINPPDENVPDVQRIDSNTLHELTTRGKIPKRPEAYVERTQILNELKNKVRQLGSEKSSWLVIYGMSGCGKSVLASECVRDPTIIGTVFPQIYWLKLSVSPKKSDKKKPANVDAMDVDDTSTGTIDDDEFNSEDEILRSALNFLYQKTKCQPYFSRVEEGFSRLTDVMMHEFPKSLIVLDDVSSPDHVKMFDDHLPCRFLVTTQNEAVCSQISGNKYIFPVDPVGFTKQETFEAFSKWLRTTHDKLPRQDVLSIFDESKGHPFVVSLIGSLLRQHNNRWKLYTEYLRRRRFKKLKLTNSHTNYPYNSFADAAEFTIDNLSYEFKKLYLDLSIFPVGVKFSAQVLSVLWNQEYIEVEDNMDKLVERQLLTKFNEEPNSKCDSYSIHDLLHNYIKTLVSTDRKQQLHRQLVENYRRLVHGRWSNLPKDDYIHWFIGYHAFRACWHEIFPDIYLDLRFLREKLLTCGPADVLGDFVRYAEYIEDNNEKKFREFRLFLCRNSHFFVSPSTDIVQLALLEPEDSLVRQATMEILSENSINDKFYVVSLLENCVEERKRCLLTCKCHKGSVTRALWLPKGEGFVSCSVDKTLKVCSSRSGVEFERFKLSRAASCFSLSSDGSKALVAVESRLFLYELSPSSLHESVNSLIVPGCVAGGDSQDRTPSPLINQPVWERQESVSSTRGVDEERDLIDSPGDHLAVLTTSNGNGEEYLWCEISHDGYTYASCGRHNNILIWSSVNVQLIDEFVGHTKSITCCKFSDDDSTLASSSDDCTVKIWNLMRRHLVFTFLDHSSPVSCLCFVPKSSKIASAAQSTILLWTLPTTTNANSIVSQPSSVQFDARSNVICIDSSPCGTYLAAGLINSSIMCWRIETATLLFVVIGHSGWINSIRFSPDSTKLLSASDDGTSAIWSATNGDTTENVRLSQVYTICLNENGHFLIGADHENRLVTMDLPSKNVLARTSHQSSPITCLSLPPSGFAPLVVGYKNGSVTMFDPFSTQFDVREVLPGHMSAATCVVHSNDGNFFACGAEKGNINVWMFEETRPLILKGHTMEVVKVKFLNENRRKLISGSYDGGIGVWNLENDGKCYRFKRLHADRIVDLDLSKDESFVCTASVDKTLKVWNWQSDQEIFTFQLDDCVRCCRFSPSDCYIMAGVDDGTVKVWSKQTGAVVMSQRKCHDTWINDAHFSSDENLLVTISNSIKFWSVEKNLCLQTYPLPGNLVNRLFVVRNFNFFLTVDVFGNVHMIKKFGLIE